MCSTTSDIRRSGSRGPGNTWSRGPGGRGSTVLPWFSLLILIAGPLASAQEDAPGSHGIEPRLAEIGRRIARAAEEADSPAERAELLTRAAELVVQAGDRPSARELWARATIEAADGPAIRPGTGPSMVGIAISLQRGGEPEAALKAAEQAREIALAMPNTDQGKRNALMNVILVQRAAGDEPAARATLAQALEAFERAEGQDSLGQQQAETVASMLTAMGDTHELMRRIVEPLPDGLPVPERDRASFLRAIAGYAFRDPGPDYAETLDAALPLALGLEDPYTREQTLMMLARAEARIGRIEEALRIVEGLPATMALRVPLDDLAIRNRLTGLVPILREIGEAQARADRPAEARETLAEAVAQALTVDHESSRAELLRPLAHAQAVAGDLDAARETVAQIPLPWLTSARKQLAEQRREAGDAEGMKVVLMDALREAETRLREVGTDESRRDLAMARADLGELEAAEELARALPPGELRDSAELRISFARALAGEFGPALEWCERRETPRSRAYSLSSLARQLSRQDDPPAK